MLKGCRVKYILLLIACALMNSHVSAAEQRIALVIGNSKYVEFGTLANPSNDARGVNQALKELGYATKLVIDADESTMRREVKRFAALSRGVDVALVYYAGHGSQVKGENYLLPVDLDTPKVETDIQLSSIKVDDVINSLSSRIKVILLDACRDNPALSKSMVKGRGSFSGGLAPVNASLDSTGEGIFIAYATESGSIASDGIGTSNSPFTAALLKSINDPISIDDMFSTVTREVRRTTGNKQRPYKYASLDGIFCIPFDCINKVTQKTEALNTKSELEKLSNILSDGNWIEVNNDSNAFFFYDPSSLEFFNNRAKIKTLAYRYANPTPEFPLDSFQIAEWSVDCKKEVYIMTQSDLIVEDKPFSSFTWGAWRTIEGNWFALDKNTIVNSFFLLACSRIKPPKIATENFVKFYSNTIDVKQNNEVKKSILTYFYDKESIKKYEGGAALNFRVKGSVPLGGFKHEVQHGITIDETPLQAF
jgi:hypothetical protein